MRLPWRSRAPSATMTMLSRRPASRPRRSGAHALLPALLGRVLRDEHVVTATGDGAHEGEVAAVPAHHLHHEGALVAGGRAGQVVDRVDDAVQGAVRTDRHVRADQVVVDRADQARDHEGGVVGSDGRVDLAGGDQLLEQPGPLLLEQVEAGEAAVATDDDDPVDALQQQVLRRLEPPGPLPELHAAERPDRRSTLVEDAADVLPGEPADPVAAVDHALVALVDREHLGAAADGGADDGAYRGVHALGVTSAGEDADTEGGAVVCHAPILPNEGA